MKPRILLVNPPVYDFTAYDFWVKPYGLLRVAGRIRGRADMTLFDYLDRLQGAGPRGGREDPWGRGPYRAQDREKPSPLLPVPRLYHRFGRPRSTLREFIRREDPFDFALVQTGMTYWGEGAAEVVEDLRSLSPATRIVLGGTLATLCPEGASHLGADLVVEGEDLKSLWDFTGLSPSPGEVPFWEGYSALRTGVLRLTDGCPFRCTYCALPGRNSPFRKRPLEEVLEELDLLLGLGAGDIAFYDDALLVDTEKILLPFLGALDSRAGKVRFHTPNALHAHLLTRSRARAMVEAGFTTFFLGFESASSSWQEQTGGKTGPEALESAVAHLTGAGVPGRHITAYLILGHPLYGSQELEGSMKFAHGLGIRIMFADYSPVPGSADFELARPTADLDEPLWHNKTAFPIVLLGIEEVNRLKELVHSLNGQLRSGQ